MQETQVESLGQKDPLEKEMATHSSILAGEIPWTEEPGGLQTTGSPKSGTLLSNRCCCGEVISVVSDSVRPHGLQPTGLLRPWDFPGKSTGVGCHCLLHLVTKPPQPPKPVTQPKKGEE